MSQLVLRSLRKSLLLGFVLVMSFFCNVSVAQTFIFPTSEGSEILSGTDLYNSGFPTSMDTVKVWCNEWPRMIHHWSSWRDSFKFKSNNTFVKFYVDDHYLLTNYMAPVNYTYRLTYRILGFNDLTDTVNNFVDNSDTLTISFNNYSDNTPFQKINLKKYSGFYKIMVIFTGLYTDVGGTMTTTSLTDPAWRNFKVEGTIVTQHYDLKPYGVSATNPFYVSSVPVGNSIDVTWIYSGFALTPVNFELEWTYVDNYAVNLTGGVSTKANSSVKYDFKNNATRVWLNNCTYRIPTIYPHGFIVYRVRAVRPDSVLYKYPIYSQWSLDNENGYISTLDFPSNVFQINTAYSGDSLNWQYAISFAEGGTSKHVGTFYDGLLKNRQSLTNLHTNLAKLIVTDNIYDFEGRLSIKTLPAPVHLATEATLSYVHNVDLNFITNLPYQALDFDTGLSLACPYPGGNVTTRLASNALANIYYSNHNPDTSLPAQYNSYIPDAEGYPFVQTIFEPGYADRVSAQGGAGAKLQIGATHSISNFYTDAMQKPLNALFGPNIGWSSFYNMTISQDPNEQLSMSLKDYHGRQIATAMIGAGNPVGHALTSINVPGATFYKQDLLLPTPPNQAVDTFAGTIIADRNFFNEAAGVDSLQYIYSFIPLFACKNQYLTVKGHYNYYVTDQCGNLKVDQSGVLGTNGIVSSATAVDYIAPVDFYYADAAPYHVHKTLSFYPSDIEASVDSLIKVDNCLLKEPWFIKQSVDSTNFPCNDAENADSTPCSKLKMEMMKQLLPGAVYGQYSTATGNVVGTGNSIFSLNCPPDSFHII
jgi:hypothetical protein